jgi:uncharacterized protein (DUF3820 family)
MDTQSLPLVPFGKYKGQPITTLMNDTKYLEWCKQQEWFQKFPIVYNICVNQTITTNNSNSKTSEHNKLQNLFLNNENVEKLLKIIFKKTSKNIQIGSGDIKFEGMFNWDLIVRNYQWWLCECDWSDETKDRCDCEIKKKYNERYKIPEGGEDLNFDELYCEIKPLMGDDYPCVLRKMNTQIELTNNYAKKQNEKHEQYMKNEYETDWKIRKYYNEQKGLYAYELAQGIIQPKYVLIIKDFNSTTTTKEQLITIFNQSHINIIFIDELFNNLPSQIIREQVEQIQDITIHTTPQQETEEENKLLREKLLHAEEKIKQLEEEILSLKTQKQSKSIKDYFGKK